jgi:hypothetical protein
MEKDKRKLRRRPIRYTATAVFGPGDKRTCVVSDVSEGGARIDMENAQTAPEQFVLFLSHNGAARRICKVVWRKPHQVGVSFELHRAGTTRAAPAFQAPAKATAAESAPAADEKIESVTVD